MGSVDDRVVAMKFDNKEFEQKVAGTLSVLEKLKNALNFKDSAKGMQDLSAASKNFNMENMGQAVEGIAAKFSAMGAIAFSVINNITTTVLGAASRIAKEFTLGPVQDGFAEFELNMSSIQTILANTANKGTNLDDVTHALNNLNDYADKTIYSFSQMSKNIGIFTATGVGLQDSVDAVKGLSNLAALTGTNAEDAARVTYQLSQAMSAGKLTAQDWLSVTSAGALGGEAFQNSLLQTAIALKKINAPAGITIEQWKKMGGNFKEAMADGVFTSDVLALSLQSFTGDLDKATLISKGYSEAQADAIAVTAARANASATEVKTFSQLIGTIKEVLGTGFAETFQKIFGDFEQAKELFTGLNTIFGGLIGNISHNRNATLQYWHDFGGREALIQSLRNVMWGLALIIDTVRKAFRAAFPKKTGEELISMTQWVERFTEALIPSANTLKIIGGVFGSVFSILSIGWTIVKEVAKAFFSLFSIFKVFGAAGDGPANFIGGIGDKIAALKKLLVDDGGIAHFFENITKAIADFAGGLDITGKIASVGEAIGKVKDAIVNFVAGIDFSAKYNAIVEGIAAIRDAITAFYRDTLVPAFKPAIEAFTKLKDVVTSFFSSGFESAVNSVTGAFNKFKEVFSGLFDKSISISNGMTSVADSTGRVGDRFKSLSTIGEKIGAIFDWLTQKFTQFIGWIKDIVPKITEAFSHGDFNQVLDVLNIALFFGILKLLKDTIDKFGGIFEGLKGVLKSFQADIKADALMKIAKALAILTASLLVLSLIDSAALSKSMIAMAVGIKILVKALEQLDKIGASKGTSVFKQDGKGGWMEEISGPGRLDLLALGLIAIAGAMLVLSFAVKNLSEIPMDKLVNGMSAITILLGELAIAVKLIGSPERMISTGLGIYAIAKSLQKLVEVVVAYGTIPFDTLKQGLISVSIALGVLTAAVALMPADTDSKGLGIGLIALSLLLLSKAITDLGKLEMSVLAKGLGTVALALAAITAAVKLMGSPSRMVEVGLGIAAMALALLIIGKAIENIGSMDLGTIIKGIFGINSALLSLAAATQIMKANIDGAKSIVIMTLALFGLAAVIKVFDAIGLGTILLAVLGIVVAIGLIAIAAMLIEDGGGDIAILALAGALSALGLAIATFGLGALLFAASILVMVLAIKMLIETGGNGLNLFIEYLPKIINAAVSAIVGGIKLFLESIPGLISAFGTALDALIQLVKDKARPIAEAFGVVVTEFKNWIDAHWQEIVDTGFKILVGILTGIDNNIAEITGRVISIIQQFLDELKKNENLDKLITAGADVLIQFIDGITKNMGPVTDAVLALVEEFKKQINDKKAVDKITEAAGDFLVAFVNGVGAQVNKVTKAVGQVVGTFFAEMGKNTKPIADGAFNFLINFMNGLSDSIDQNEERFRESGKKLARSILKAVANAVVDFAFLPIDAIRALGEAMFRKIAEVFVVHSPSKRMYDLATNIVKGFANGFTNNTEGVNSAERFAEDVVDKLNETFNQVSDALVGMHEFNPTITPVLDLANIERGAKRMGSLMATPKINADVSFGQAASIAVSTREQESGNADPVTPVETVKEINLTQINNSPKPLTTSDIYRNTKSQISFAKEELAAS